MEGGEGGKTKQEKPKKAPITEAALPVRTPMKAKKGAATTSFDEDDGGAAFSMKWFDKLVLKDKKGHRLCITLPIEYLWWVFCVLLNTW